MVDDTDKTSVEVRDLAVQIWEIILKYEKRAYVLELVENDYRYGTNTLDDFIMQLAQLEAGEMIRNALSS